jgi:hypothetical protein
VGEGGLNVTIQSCISKQSNASIYRIFLMRIAPSVLWKILRTRLDTRLYGVVFADQSCLVPVSVNILSWLPGNSQVPML